MRAAARRRRRAEQRQLAVDLQRRRRSGAAHPPPLQPEAASRSATIPTARTWRPLGARQPRAGADRRPRRRAQAHAGGLRPRQAARKLPRIGTFTIEPRGPFTLASAARFIAGWPPGQGDLDDDDGPPALPGRRLERPGRASVHARTDDVVHADGRGRSRGARVRAGRAHRSRSTTTAPATRRSSGPVVGSSSSRAATCAPCCSTRPTRPPPGRCISARTGHAQATKLRDALSSDGVFPAPAAAARVRELDGLPDEEDPAPARHRPGRARGQAGPRAAARADAEEALAELQELPGIGPFYAALILLRAVGPTDFVANRTTSRKAVEARYGRPLADVADGWRPFRTWVSVLDAGERMTEELYVQRDQPPGVPPLHLTGERTLPDVPEENYWYRRHLVVYEWIAARVARAPGRRPGVRRGLRLRRAGANARVAWSASTPTLRPSSTPRASTSARSRFERNMIELWQGDVDCVVFLQTIEHVQDPGRDARAHPRADRARRRRLRLHAERAHARARGRGALRQPVARERVQARGVPRAVRAPLRRRRAARAVPRAQAARAPVRDRAPGLGPRPRAPAHHQAVLRPLHARDHGARLRAAARRARPRARLRSPCCAP